MPAPVSASPAGVAPVRRARRRAPRRTHRSPIALPCVAAAAHLALVAALLLLTTPAATMGSGRAVRVLDDVGAVSVDTVTCLLRDSRGFVWLGTARGLVRLDATGLVTFGPREGLPDPVVNDILEDRAGRLWIATNGGGLARLLMEPTDPPDAVRGGRSATSTSTSATTAAATATATAAAAAAAGSGAAAARERSRGAALRPLFETVTLGRDRRTNRVNVIAELPDGSLLAGTDGGLFKVPAERPQLAQPVRLSLPGLPDALLGIWAIHARTDRDLWIGTNAGLVHHRVGGFTRLYRDRLLPSRQIVRTLFVEPDGQVLAAFGARVIAIDPDAPIPDGQLDYVFSDEDCAPPPAPDQGPEPGANRGPRPTAMPASCIAGVTHQRLQEPLLALLRPTPDRLVAVSARRVVEHLPDGTWRTLHDVEDDEILSARLLRDGHVWLGTRVAGAVRLTDTPLTLFTADDGLDTSFVRGLFHDADGRVYAVGRNWQVAQYDGERFQSTSLRGAEDWSYTGWIEQVLRTRDGEWWASTGQGLVRYADVGFAALSRAAPTALYRLEDDLRSVRLRGLFADSRGDLWAGTISEDGFVALTRRDRATGAFRRFTEADGLDRFAEATSFAEDRAGRVWVGFRDGGLARIDGGRVLMLRDAEGIPTAVRAMHVDASNRLWIALRFGTVRIDDPGAARPRAQDVPETRRLTSDSIASIAEDMSGFLYFAHDTGIDRLDPRTGGVVTFGPRDGLPSRASVLAGLSGPDGAAWFATTRGIVRLAPAHRDPGVTPRALFGTLIINGVPQWLAAAGAGELAPLTLVEGAAALELRFLAVPALPDSRPSFQYRLVRDDEEEAPWSVPSPERTLTLASLAPGSWRIDVRASANAGAAGDASSVHLRVNVLQPIWRRDWVRGLAGLTVLGVALVIRRAIGGRLRRGGLRIRPDGTSLPQIGDTRARDHLAPATGPRAGRRGDRWTSTSF